MLLHLLLTNSIETIFLTGIVFIIYCEKFLYSFKDFVMLIFIEFASYFIQKVDSPFNIILIIVVYYIIFRTIYFHGNRLALLKTIVLSFGCLASIQAIVYPPLILFFNLNILAIHKNVFNLFIVMIPCSLIEIIILIILYNRRKEK